jgi:hypothetical protein
VRIDVVCIFVLVNARAVGDAEMPKPGLTVMFSGAEVVALKFASPV